MVGAATAKLREPKHVGGHVGQPTNYSLMNEVYETERTVSIQSEDRQAGDPLQGSVHRSIASV